MRHLCQSHQWYIHSYCQAECHKCLCSGHFLWYLLVVVFSWTYLLTALYSSVQNGESQFPHCLQFHLGSLHRVYIDLSYRKQAGIRLRTHAEYVLHAGTYLQSILQFFSRCIFLVVKYPHHTFQHSHIFRSLLCFRCPKSSVKTAFIMWLY